MEEEEDISELLRKGLVLTDNRKYDEAETLFKCIIATLEKCNASSNCPYLCEAYNNLGLIQYKKVEFQKAITSYDRSIQIDNSFAPAYYNQGTIYYRLGSYETALEKMTKAVSLQPSNIEFQKGFNATFKIIRDHPWVMPVQYRMEIQD
ncbi:tetratricopeptide repeat protein 32 isoform X2 [Parasteatoda tepidariorum]|uniref:tetratricopeptide repeat protein 32 isoform X2 n=1 Tax=Parasteatoda tepidariorum TaxID=114398 RepID=UPI00077F96E2|nr:tetratricopeptide repeat protein 32 isoform X2 [Parasteatoda tepidariorum]